MKGGVGREDGAGGWEGLAPAGAARAGQGQQAGLWVPGEDMPRPGQTPPNAALSCSEQGAARRWHPRAGLLPPPHPVVERVRQVLAQRRHGDDRHSTPRRPVLHQLQDGRHVAQVVLLVGRAAQGHLRQQGGRVRLRQGCMPAGCPADGPAPAGHLRHAGWLERSAATASPGAAGKLQAGGPGPALSGGLPCLDPCLSHAEFIEPCPEEPVVAQHVVSAAQQCDGIWRVVGGQVGRCSSTGGGGGWWWCVCGVCVCGGQQRGGQQLLAWAAGTGHHPNGAAGRGRAAPGAGGRRCCWAHAWTACRALHSHSLSNMTQAMRPLAANLVKAQPGWAAGRSATHSPPSEATVWESPAGVGGGVGEGDDDGDGDGDGDGRTAGRACSAGSVAGGRRRRAESSNHERSL